MELTKNNKNNSLKFNQKILKILRCPLTKDVLQYDETNQELISKSAKLAFKIENNIPIMLISKARKID
jgi:uncharacterized protein YbaR (Trm112 family)